MQLAKLYQWGQSLPPSIRPIARFLTQPYFKYYGYPLGGILTGCRMQGPVNDPYLQGVYEPQVAQIIAQIVRPGWVCVDLGANIGYFTLLLAKLVGKRGYVFAFEAHPENAKKVGTNVKLSGYQHRTTVEKMAISDGTSRSIKLFPGRGHRSAEWNIVGHDVEGNTTQAEMEIPATSLDIYFPAKSHLDFIKMDIEGAEFQALSGMQHLLQESKPLMLIEFHNRSNWLGGLEVLSSNYDLYDIKNFCWLDDLVNQVMVHHCLAVPKEQKLAVSQLLIPT